MSNKNTGPKDPTNVATDRPVSPAELITQKDQLALEKLRLDIEEQRIRIAQLQIRWWQKPAAQYGVIAPLIGFIVFLANNATRDVINQANYQKQQAEIEKQNYEFIKQRLELESKTLETRVAQLARDEQRLVHDAFQQYVKICEIGGRLAAAESAPAARMASNDLPKALLAIIDANLHQAVMGINEAVGVWEMGGQSDELNRVRMLACARMISSACNQKFHEDYASKYPKAIRELAIEVYREALDATKGLLDRTDREGSTAAIEHFLEIYYGKFALIEPNQNERLRTAMSNAEIALFQRGNSARNTDVLERLSNVITKELGELQIR